MSMKKRNKFGAIKATYKGATYDSKSEAKYAQILDDLLFSGKVLDVKRQVKYPMPNMKGEMRLSYIADFVVTSRTGVEYIIDVKGILTPANTVKLSYFQYYYNKKVWLVFNSGLKAYDTSFII